MAGKKEKKPGEKKASLLPKSIAGMKLPKELRRKLEGLAKHPVVADLLAAGLVSLAAKLKKEPAETGGATADATPAPASAAAKPVVKRARKPAAPNASAAKPAAARPATAKPASAKAATARTPAKPRKPAAAKSAPAKPAAAKPATAKAPAKPRSARKPAAPKTSS